MACTYICTVMYIICLWIFFMTTVSCSVYNIQLLIWSPSAQAPVQRHNEHKAAIKAIAWSPHQHGILASGGGTADRTIRFWNTLTGQALQSIDTESQVRELLKNKDRQSTCTCSCSASEGGGIGRKHRFPTTSLSCPRIIYNIMWSGTGTCLLYRVVYIPGCFYTRRSLPIQCDVTTPYLPLVYDIVYIHYTGM